MDKNKKDYYVCEGCERVKVGDPKKYSKTISLQIGQKVVLDGIEYEYLGYGVLGNN